MRRILFTSLMLGSIAALTALVAEPGRASLYAPDDPRFVIPVGIDGKVQALPFGDFKLFLASLMNSADDRKKADGNVNSDREKMLKRIGERRGKKLSPAETTALATDLLRAGKSDDALNLLKPLARGRNPDYLVYTALAHIHAARGEWREAIEYHQTALLDSEMPAQVKGLTQPQRDWIAKLDRDYLPHYYQIRLKDATTFPRPNPADEDVFPLFPIPERNKPHQPVRFVNDTGAYQPGTLAASERAKLPPDAIAVVQQLLFWFPQDTRLYWLLAELYAADGQTGPARDIMDVAVSEARQYGNRKILADHRMAVRAADDAKPRAATPEETPLIAHPAASDAPPAPPAQEPISMRTVWIYFGAVGVIAVFAFWRALSRRMKGDCGPVG